MPNPVDLANIMSRLERLENMQTTMSLKTMLSANRGCNDFDDCGNLFNSKNVKSDECDDIFLVNLQSCPGDKANMASSSNEKKC